MVLVDEDFELGGCLLVESGYFDGVFGYIWV